MIPAKQQNERWSTNKSSIDVSNARLNTIFLLHLLLDHKNYFLPFQTSLLQQQILDFS